MSNTETACGTMIVADGRDEAPALSSAAVRMDYPRPRIPTAPVLSLASLSLSGGKNPPSILDTGGARFVTSGRMAIGLALRHMKIGPDDKVLVPAYHCSSMVEPVISVGATPVFYKIQADTSVNLADAETRLDGSVKVLLATHYFGFPQDLPALRNFCDAHGLLLLEDCAHAFFGERAGRPIGSYGDYAIASSMKFFPIFDGGCLVSARHDIGGLTLQSAGAGFQVKAALNTLEKGFEYGRLKALALLLYLPIRLKSLLWGQMKSRSAAAADSLTPGASHGGFSFDPRWIDKKSSACSRLLLKLTSKTRIAAKRRGHYLRLHAALAELPGASPLFSTLPDEVVPYVYPLLVDDPEAIFPLLKNAGIPVVRFGEFLWDGVDATVCPVSVDLSRRVMQFPCHQELRPSELEWMIASIRDIFANLAQKG